MIHPKPPPPSPEVVLSISPDVLDLLFARFGAPADADAGFLAAVRALFERRAPAKLLRALAFIARFATAAGRGAFVEAARAVEDPRKDAWRAIRAADVAATIAIERATAKGRARRIIERITGLAQLRMDRELPPRVTYELLMAAQASRDESAARAIRQAFGDIVFDVWSHVDPDGTRYLAVFARVPVESRLVVERGKIRARVDDTMAVDIVRISPKGDRVALTLATPELLPLYVSALSLSLLPSLSLKPLHDITPEDLARIVAEIPGVRAITVVGERWRDADGARFEARSRDVVHDAAAHGATPRGYVDRATIRVDLGDRFVDAFLQAPHRVEISDRAFEPIVREVLAALGLFDPGALPDDARSLAGSPHPEWRWRAVIGDAGFEALVRRGLLVRVEVAHVATEAMRMHGASYVVRSVPGAPGVEYALAEDRAYGARLVTREERVAWRLDVEALAAAMRADLGATAPDKGSAIVVTGMLDLGTVVLNSGKLRFVYAMGAPPKGWLESVRRACGVGVTPVVLVPKGYGEGIEGVMVLELDVGAQLGTERIGRVLGRAAVALNVADEVDPWRTCEEDVVVDAATQQTWVKGVLVPLSDAPYRMAEILASSARVVGTKEIGEKLTSGDYPVEAARRIKMVLETQVRDALTAAGVVLGVESLVVTEGKKGYRLALSARVVG
jgi:hypothetical protein